MFYKACGISEAATFQQGVLRWTLMLPLGEKNTCFKGHLTICTQNFVQCSLPLPIIRHDLYTIRQSVPRQPFTDGKALDSNCRLNWGWGCLPLSAKPSCVGGLNVALAVCCHGQRPLNSTCQGCRNRITSCDEMFCVFQWLFSQPCTVRVKSFLFKRRHCSCDQLSTLRTRGPSSTSTPPSPSSWLGSREPCADEYRNLYYFGGYP